MPDKKARLGRAKAVVITVPGADLARLKGRLYGMSCQQSQRKGSIGSSGRPERR